MTHANEQMPLVSVVTPVYNGERYLVECIESVLKQTYPNLEYIIVDNCSDDRTPEIVEAYRASDPRIRVITNERTVPVIENHNVAFSMISPSARYCKVVQADDWIFPECLSRMVELAEEHPSARIVGSYSLWGERVRLDGLPFGRSVFPGAALCRSLMLYARPNVFGQPTCLLYRARDVRMRERFFDEETLFADDEICLELLEDGDFGFVHQVLSFCRDHPETATRGAARRMEFKLAFARMLVKFGPTYLTSEELEGRLKAYIRHYHRALCGLLLTSGGREVLRFHAEGLRTLGLNLSTPKMWGWLLWEGCDHVLNPKQTGGRLMRAFRGRPEARDPFEEPGGTEGREERRQES